MSKIKSKFVVRSPINLPVELSASTDRLPLKCDGTRAETRFRLSAKRTSPFKSAGGVSSVDYWQASCAHQPAAFVLLVQACVLQSRDAYWLPHSIFLFPLHFSSRASPCAITFQLDSTALEIIFGCLSVSQNIGSCISVEAPWRQNLSDNSLNTVHTLFCG
jgi:hypothetical protein